MEGAQPCLACGQSDLRPCPAKATICDHDAPVRPHDREGALRGPIQSMCRPRHSANTVTGAHIDGARATVEDAQTPVTNLDEELTDQLGGLSGTAVAVPGISSHDLAA